MPSTDRLANKNSGEAQKGITTYGCPIVILAFVILLILVGVLIF